MHTVAALPSYKNATNPMMVNRVYDEIYQKQLEYGINTDSEHPMKSGIVVVRTDLS
jgi:hypothetical protein